MNDQRAMWQRAHEHQADARQLAEVQRMLAGSRAPTTKWRHRLATVLRALAQRLEPLAEPREGAPEPSMPV